MDQLRPGKLALRKIISNACCSYEYTKEPLGHAVVIKSEATDAEQKKKPYFQLVLASYYMGASSLIGCTPGC